MGLKPMLFLVASLLVVTSRVMPLFLTLFCTLLSKVKVKWAINYWSPQSCSQTIWNKDSHFPCSNEFLILYVLFVFPGVIQRWGIIDRGNIRNYMCLPSFRFFVLLDMLSSMLHVGCKNVSKYWINVIFISRIKGQAGIFEIFNSQFLFSSCLRPFHAYCETFIHSSWEIWIKIYDR